MSDPGSGRSSGEGNGNSLQYSCLENHMDRGAWWTTVIAAAAAAAAAAKSLQSCLTLWDPIADSPPGSAIPGILQAKTLEWVAISFSNAWKVKSESRVTHWLFETPWTAAYQAPLPMGFSRQEYWSGLPLPSPTIVIRKMQIKTVMRHPFITTRMAIIKKTNNNKSGRTQRSWTSMYHWWGCKMAELL